eukprot:1158736-Pelagomonas_calceolata.AAC.3
MDSVMTGMFQLCKYLFSHMCTHAPSPHTHTHTHTQAMLDAAAGAVLRSGSASPARPNVASSSARQQQQPFLLPPKYVGGSPDLLGLPGLGTDTETTPEAVARAARQGLHPKAATRVAHEMHALHHRRWQGLRG